MNNNDWFIWFMLAIVMLCCCCSDSDGATNYDVTSYFRNYSSVYLWDSRYTSNNPPGQWFTGITRTDTNISGQYHVQGWQGMTMYNGAEVDYELNGIIDFSCPITAVYSGWRGADADIYAKPSDLYLTIWSRNDYQRSNIRLQAHIDGISIQQQYGVTRWFFTAGFYEMCGGGDWGYTFVPVNGKIDLGGMATSSVSTPEPNSIIILIGGIMFMGIGARKLTVKSQ